jgi:hypothetical protein
MTMRAGALWPYAAMLGYAVIYGAFVATFFAAPPGRLGHDYAYFLPVVLAGRYWIANNGFFAIPDFSPAFCGGLPFLANPQSLFYSAPQALAQWVDPVTSFLVTTVLFGCLGGIGTFALLRVRFRTSTAAASFGAVVFLFNGFLLYRMAIGHVTNHAVGLMPLLCYVLLTPLAGRPDRLRHGAAAAALGGAILGYFVYAGAANALVPLALSVLAVWLLHALSDRPVASFWLLGMGAALVGAAVGAAKLVPALVYVAGFPRAEDIQLFPDAGTALSWLLRGLFLPTALPVIEQQHELEFGLGLVPALLIAGTALVAIARGAARRVPSRGTWLAAASLALVLTIPLWLNSGGPGFAAWLKSLPYIGENVVLVRWFFVYLLPTTIGAALALDYLFAGPRTRAAAALIGMLATLVQTVAADQTHYRNQPYDPTVIVAADRALRATGAVPPIRGIAAGKERQSNDGLAAGQSAFPCYEPLFGYKLQRFPSGMVPGPLALPDHHPRNPACYIYGRENDCSPGDSFSLQAAEEEAAFADYRPFPYREPRWQKAAKIVSAIGLAVVAAGILLGVFARRRYLSLFRWRKPLRG